MSRTNPTPSQPPANDPRTAAPRAAGGDRDTRHEPETPARTGSPAEQVWEEEGGSPPNALGATDSSKPDEPDRR
jgi:hypothetical protein